MEKNGRNDPCPCGSGKKYKQCCLLLKVDRGIVLPLLRGKMSAEPASADKINQLAALFNGGRFLEMERAARLMVEQDPNSGLAWKALSASLLAQGRSDLNALQRASQLLPADPEACNNLGNALREYGRFDEAVGSYRRALELNVYFAEAHCGLGVCLLELGLPDNAIVSYRRALEINSSYAMAHNNLGNALSDIGQFDEAMASYRRALEIAPDFVMAHNNLGNALWKTGQLQEADAKYRRAIQLMPDYAEAHTNLLMALQFMPTIGRDDMFAAHLQFGRQFESALKPHWIQHTNSRDPRKRLRIGYVSGDFRMHAVAYFIEPVLANHDKSQVEVFCYTNSTKHDAITDRLRTAVDHWLPCLAMSDIELADRIRADGIDILVDLSGHTANNRLLTFARKPAPIQVTYLGYPNTSGLTAIDYRLTDDYTEPRSGDADQYYTEKLLRLSNSVWCYRPHDQMPEITLLPALQNGYLTFGSFNNVNKVGLESITLWAKLLRALPTSRLIVATVTEGEIRTRLKREFAEYGVAEDRIDFCGKLHTQEFLNKMQEVDVTLDPFPVNGATTTCESLWLGIPVLTLVGDRFLSRAGLSVLNAARLPEFAASTEEAYIEAAKSLANDLPQLAKLRAGMREQLKTTPLLDQQRFTRNLENTYREIWHRYVAT
jgi:protein O-GlcNAc transferase